MSDTPTSNTLLQWYQSLMPSERDCYDQVAMGTALWMPQSAPQAAAVWCQADELFYGGQAGGGKSDLLLGLSVIAHEKSIIFRREFAQLTALVERSREVLGQVASYNGQSHIWHDIPGGRILEFGGVQHEHDKRRYQGRPHDLKAFDEVSEFTESQYRFLTGWARSTTPGQRVRVVATGNPPTHAEGMWVIQHWGPWLDDQHPNPALPGELRWFAVIDGKDTEVEGPEPFEHNDELVLPKSRTFIPAALSDNPYLMDTGYEAILQGLPEPLRSQLLYGDFGVGVQDDPWQVIPTDWVRQAFRRYEEREKPEVALSSLGVDVARGGDDQTIICKRYGSYIPPLLKWPGAETKDGPAVAALVVQALGDDLQVPIRIDVIGLGSSPYDSLVYQGLNVTGVNFAEASRATDASGRLQMRNLRAEAYWKAREALDPNKGDDLAIAPDNELLADLTAAKWKVTPSGIQIESKEDIKKRIGRSTDCGDAFVLSLMDGGYWYLTGGETG